MAKDLNKVMITGRLGADPETRHTSSGKSVVSFNVASGRSYNTGVEKRDETEWFSVVAWEKLGEICAQYLTKGSRVYIEGRLLTRKWDDDSGVTHYKTEVIASDMIMLGDGGKQNDTQDAPAKPAPKAAAPRKNAVQAIDDSENLPF